MPNTREKLMKIVREKATELPGLGVSATQTLRFVDHLIANGVTVQGDKDINVPTKWISVKDRLPEKYGRYLALTPSRLKGKEYAEWLIYYLPQSGFYDTDPEWGDIEMDDVTHWMTLPQPPKGE